MVRTLFLILFVVLMLMAKDEIQKEVTLLDEQIDELYKEILSVSKNRPDYTQKINNLANPFVSLEKRDDLNLSDQNNTNASLQNSYLLQAIIDKKAKIDGKWYKKGDVIGWYKIVDISNSKVKMVLIEQESQTRELFIDANKILDIKEVTKHEKR